MLLLVNEEWLLPTLKFYPFDVAQVYMYDIIVLKVENSQIMDDCEKGFYKFLWYIRF